MGCPAWFLRWCSSSLTHVQNVHVHRVRSTWFQTSTSCITMLIRLKLRSQVRQSIFCFLFKVLFPNCMWILAMYHCCYFFFFAPALISFALCHWLAAGVDPQADLGICREYLVTSNNFLCVCMSQISLELYSYTEEEEFKLNKETFEDERLRQGTNQESIKGKAAGIDKSTTPIECSSLAPLLKAKECLSPWDCGCSSRARNCHSRVARYEWKLVFGDQTFHFGRQ